MIDGLIYYKLKVIREAELESFSLVPLFWKFASTFFCTPKKKQAHWKEVAKNSGEEEEEVFFENGSLSCRNGLKMEAVM